MRKKCVIWMTAMSVACAIAVSGCGSSEEAVEQADSSEQVEEAQSSAKLIENVDTGTYDIIGDYPISDNEALYEEEDDDGVVTMYLTVSKGNEGEDTDHTWSEINGHSSYYYEDEGIEKYQMDALLQVGDEEGATIGSLGYGLSVPNATIQIRGKSSSLNAQKSYKISIKDGNGSFQDQTTINLNKHVADGVRFRNKLCYELMQEVPGMFSARTQFVHLYVKDLSSSEEADFTDYGLYTQVEQVNKTYLRAHGLDRNGQLYKANFFEFTQEEALKLTTDEGYDEDAFEDYLESKGDEDHTKILTMLAELNDDSIPIETTFEKWFDEENYFTWMAYQILVGNIDTKSQNFYLYSPQNINKFYFISWDNDASLKTYEYNLLNYSQGGGYESGISTYWGSMLHSRVLKSAGYRAKLQEKMEEVKEILSKDRVDEKVKEYAAITKEYAYSLPDVTYENLTKAEFEDVAKKLSSEVDDNYEKYLQSLETPMPFYIGEPEGDGDGLKFTWNSAYDFKGETITYKMQLATDSAFKNIVAEKDLYQCETKVDNVTPGQYFVRVMATNESGYSQYAFDYYTTENGKVYGTKCFYLDSDGSIRMVDSTDTAGE